MNAAYDSEILSHYRSVAEEEGLSAASTMADKITRSRESDLILATVARELARRGPRLDVFDVGCGNGYTLSLVSESNTGARCRGYEYTPELAALARKRFEGSETEIISADIRSADWNAGHMADVVIVQRVLINLLEPDHQRAALANILSGIRPGGVALFIEAFQSGLDNLNRARDEFALPPIPPAHHNLPLGDDFFEAVKDSASVETLERGVPPNFLSTHYTVEPNV